MMTERTFNTTTRLQAEDSVWEKLDRLVSILNEKDAFGNVVSVLVRKGEDNTIGTAFVPIVVTEVSDYDLCDVVEDAFDGILEWANESLGHIPAGVTVWKREG